MFRYTSGMAADKRFAVGAASESTFDAEQDLPRHGGRDRHLLNLDPAWFDQVSTGMEPARRRQYSAHGAPTR